MKRTITLITTLAIVVFMWLPFVPAQTQREVLTNTKIIELVRIGLDDDIIVEKIRQSEGQYDTSTEGLTKLKAAKVSGAVILAMMNASSGGPSYSENNPSAARTTRVPEANTSEPGADVIALMPEPGIYLFEDGKAIGIEATVYSGSKGSFWGTALTYGIKKSKIRAVVRGKSAQMQVKSARPVFYFLFQRESSTSGAAMSGFGGLAATSPAEFMMIAMKQKDSTREATLGEFSMYSSSTGASDKDIREFSFEKIRPGLYKVTPKTDLATGEYAFYYAGNGGAGSKLFDFGVTH